MEERREMKFCHICQKITPAIVNALSGEVPARSGMYNWINIFKGEIREFNTFKGKEDFEQYDVIQINMSPMDMVIIPQIRYILGDNSSTQLVINNDYVCETWDEAFQQPPGYYDNLQKMGDMVFSTEPHQVSNMIEGTHVIPHATNTKYLKKFRADGQNNTLGTIFHWWHGDTYLPSRTANLIKKDNGLDQSILYSYQDGSKRDKMYRWAKIMWDKKVGGLNLPEYLEALGSSKLIYEPCAYHTYGRNTVETACIKVPVVGSDRIYSMQINYPNCICDPYDAKKTREIAKKLLTDEKWKDEQVELAHANVEFFNYANSKNRFLNALEISKQRGGSEWYRRNG